MLPLLSRMCDVCHLWLESAKSIISNILRKGKTNRIENRNAKTNVSPSVGANDFKCPYCKELGRQFLSYEEVMHIRAYGGGKSNCECVMGHHFNIAWYVWTPFAESEVQDGRNA